MEPLARRQIGQGMTIDETNERRDCHDPVGHHGSPGRGHVDEHDTDGIALLVIRRRPKAEVKPQSNQYACNGRQPRQ
jgi:hypothetical protein